MAALALAVACSLAVAVLLKLAERRGLDRVGVLTANYAAALAVALGGARGAGGGSGVVALGAATGVLFIGGFYVFGAAIGAAGVGLAAGVMRLSVVVPVLASWALWGERPTAGQGGGLLVAVAAFLLLARPAGTGPEAPAASRPASAPRARATFVLAALFVAGGLGDLAMKTYDEAFAAGSRRAFFLLVAFGAAFAVGLALVVGRRVRTGRWPERAAWAWGGALGVANYGSAEFLLRAVEALPAAVVFPATNVAVVGGAAALGAAVWGERLSRANGAGLALAALALALLWA